MADENDDLLNPDEIEQLLNTAGEGAHAPSADRNDETAESAPSPEAGDDDQAEPEAAPSAGATSGESEEHTPHDAEALLDQAAADLATAVADDLDQSSVIPPELGSAEPFQFQDFAREGGGGTLPDFGLKSLEDVELDLRIELGRAELLIEEVLTLEEGSVVPLDKLAGDPVDILVNGRLIARGEVLVLNDNFCVRVAEILTPQF